MEGLRDARARHAHTIVGLRRLLAAHGAQWREQALQADARGPLGLGGAEGCSTTARVGVRRQAAAGWMRWAPAARSHRLQGLRLYARALTHLRRAGDRLRPQDAAGLACAVSRSCFAIPGGEGAAGRLRRAVRLGAGYRRAARAAWHRLRSRCAPSPSEGRARRSLRRTHVRFAAAPFEGRMRVTLSGSWGRETQDITAGACSCRSAQASARLVMQSARAAGAGLVCRVGLLQRDAIEQKEYLEPYVRGTDRTYRARTAPAAAG